MKHRGYTILVDRTSRKTRMVRVPELGIEFEVHAGLEHAYACGRAEIDRHLQEHGPRPVERPAMTDEEQREVFGRF